MPVLIRKQEQINHILNDVLSARNNHGALLSFVMVHVGTGSYEVNLIALVS